jgi:Cu(I)/Ag(I) efflux system membrane fusion protein
VDLGEKLAVSTDAVLDTGTRKIVYVVKKGDMLEQREVNVGQTADGFYEVLGGLSEGEVVVTSGNFLVDSESKLKSAGQNAEHKHGQ